MIETARLRLRVPTASDRAALHAMWADPVVMADLAPVKSAEESDETLARHNAYRARRLGFLVVDARDGASTIGFCGLKPGADETPIAGEIEIGWMFARAYWGWGYAHEAASACLAWGWANHAAPRIVAITAACNKRSRALMERLGMAYQPGGDFNHPRFALDDPRRRTVTYALARP
jgi:ribosomal-protein-alanine N-acetyltransferase